MISCFMEFVKKIYNKCPPRAQKLIKLSYKNIPFPFRLGLNFSFIFKGLMKTQWLSSKEIEKLQNKKFIRIINHAYHNVPYYHKIMKKYRLRPGDFHSINDLKKMPILTKDVIRENFEDFFAKNYQLYGGRINKTSGSTGSPISIRLSKTTLAMELANTIRHSSWMGYNPKNDKMVIFRPPPSVINGSANFGLRSEYKMDSNSLFLTTYNLSDEVCNHHVKNLLLFKPRIVYGTPSALFLIAKFILKHNIEINGIKGVKTASETLYKSHRNTIGEAFNSDVFDWYGQGEFVASCCECNEHNYHINAEFGYFEFINDGEAVSTGEEGEIVVTNFVNKSMPLIRYLPGDIGIPSDDECNCGRKLPIIKSIKGKTREIVICKNGKRIHGEFFTRVFESQYWIKESQIIQENYQRIRIILSLNREPSFEEKREIIKNIKKVVGLNTEIIFDYVKEISPTKAGKRHFIISKVGEKDGEI